MSQPSRQVGLNRAASSSANLLVVFSLLLAALPSQTFAETGEPNPTAPALSGNVPPASIAPTPFSSISAAPTIAPSALITIGAGGFTPGLLSTNANIPVVWVNATNATQVLESGAPFHIYLPLIARGATGTAADNAAAALPTAPHAASALFMASIAPGGRFTYTFGLAGTYPYFVLALPQFTGSVYVGDPLPPDPALVAPPVDASVATNLCAATQFLYSGGTLIQTGVISGTIACQRIAVLRGKVIQRDGTPLSGVVITILGHPEFGQTLSRADGRYDLALNGGGALTVNYNGCD